MGDITNISWCDSTWNPWHGCTKVSPGCSACYAETLVMNRMGGGPYRKGIPRVRHAEATFNAPLRWNKRPFTCDCGVIKTAEPDRTARCPICASPFRRRRVFSLSLGDWLDDEVPIEWLADMLDIIRRCPDLDFLLLTKRPENCLPRMLEAKAVAANSCLGEDKSARELRDWLSLWLLGFPPPNIWIGASVEDQQRADERIPELLKIPAAIRFLSVEPMLGPIDLARASELGANAFRNGIHWAIFGGESGAGARPCNVEWIRDGIRQCRAAGVKAFTKQMGSNAFGPESDKWITRMKDTKGGDLAEFPEDLRVREWPQSKQRT